MVRTDLDNINNTLTAGTCLDTTDTYAYIARAEAVQTRAAAHNERAPSAHRSGHGRTPASDAQRVREGRAAHADHEQSCRTFRRVPFGVLHGWRGGQRL